LLLEIAEGIISQADGKASGCAARERKKGSRRGGGGFEIDNISGGA